MTAQTSSGEARKIKLTWTLFISNVFYSVFYNHLVQLEQSSLLKQRYVFRLNRNCRLQQYIYRMVKIHTVIWYLYFRLNGLKCLDMSKSHLFQLKAFFGMKHNMHAFRCNNYYPLYKINWYMRILYLSTLLSCDYEVLFLLLLVA